MASEKEGADAFEPSRLDDRVLTTLQGLSGQLAFSGLKRVLGAHPESLARALRRLEREGLVERVDGGYRALAPLPSSPQSVPTPLRTIAAVDLPPAVSTDELRARLTGRWFGALRWVGVVERDGERLLAWARRDGSEYVLLGIDGGRLRVSVPGEPNAETIETDDAAYELLVHAVDALRPSGRREGTVSFYALPVPASDWGEN
jgi:hypothetical protein